MVEHNALLAAAYNNMPDAFLLVACHCTRSRYLYTIQSVNRVLCQLAEMPEQALLGQKIHKVVDAPTYWKFSHYSTTAINTGAAVSYEHRVKLSQGNCFFSITIVPCAEQGKPCDHILVVVRNTTSERQKTTRLLAALQEGKRVIATMEARQRSLVQTVIEVQEEELKRIALALHEEFAQVLSAAIMRFSALDVVVGKSVYEQEQHVGYAVEVMNSLLHDIKAIAYDLMPIALHTFGLVAALEDLFLSMGKVVSATFSLHTYGYRKLVWAIEVTLYRIIREIISTVYTCFDGADISVQLVMHQQRLSIVMDDNGKCTLAQEVREENKNNREQALRGVITRVQLLNGLLNIDSHAQSGTVIAIDIPLHDSFFADESDENETREM